MDLIVLSFRETQIVSEKSVTVLSNTEKVLLNEIKHSLGIMFYMQKILFTQCWDLVIR